VKSGKFSKRLGNSSFLLFSAICGMAGSSVASASGEEDLAKEELAKESDVLEDFVGKEKNEEVDSSELDDGTNTDDSEDAVDDEDIAENEDEFEKDSQNGQNPGAVDLGTEGTESDGSKEANDTGSTVYLDNEDGGHQKYVYLSENGENKDIEEIDELIEEVSDGKKKMLKALKVLVPSAAGGAAVGAGAFFATHPEARKRVARFFSGSSSKDNGSVLGELIDEKKLDENTKKLENGIDKLNDIDKQLNNGENKENTGDEQKNQENNQESTTQKPEKVEDNKTSPEKEQDNTAEQKTDDSLDKNQTQQLEEEQGKENFYSFVNGVYEYRSDLIRRTLGLTKELDRCADEAATEEEKKDYISVKDYIVGILFFLKDDRTLGGPRVAAILKLIHFILLCYSLVRRCYKVCAKITEIRKKYINSQNEKKAEEGEIRKIYKGIYEFDEIDKNNKKSQKNYNLLLGNLEDESEDNDENPKEILVIKNINDEEIQENEKDKNLDEFKSGTTPIMVGGDVEEEDEYGLLSAFKDVGKTLAGNILVFCAETVVPALSLVNVGMDIKGAFRRHSMEKLAKEEYEDMEKRAKNEFKEGEEFMKNGKINEEEGALALGKGLDNIFKNNLKAKFFRNLKNLKNIKNFKKDENEN